MELFEHQKQFLSANPSRHLLCWDTGTFKTRTTIEWFKKNNGDNLVICPKALRENWYREQRKWDGPAMTVLTKEEFRRDWQSLKRFSNVAVDEAHHFAGIKSQMSKALRKYVNKHKITHLLLLTATPYRSSPWDVYVLAGHLGRVWSYGKFLDTFFQERYVGRPSDKSGFKQRKIWTVREGVEAPVARLVQRIGSVVRIDECADIPDQIDETEVFELTPLQEKKKKELVEFNSMVRYTKHHEIENGFLKGDEYEPDESFPSYKEERILELARDNKKLVIVCRYHGQMERLAPLLADIGPVYKISGKVKNRDEVVTEAEAAERAIVLVQAACSEGYELPSFPLMVFASLDFSYVNYKQMRGRILRLNKLKKNVYLHLICDGVDGAVYESILRKKNFDIAIYAQEQDIK